QRVGDQRQQQRAPRAALRRRGELRALVGQRHAHRLQTGRLRRQRPGVVCTDRPTRSMPARLSSFMVLTTVSYFTFLSALMTTGRWSSPPCASFTALPIWLIGISRPAEPV